MSRQKVLIACYGAAHIEIIYPLIAHLRELFDVTLIAINTAAEKLENLQIEHTKILDLISILNLQNETQYWGEIALSNTKEQLSLSQQSSKAYLGINLYDLSLQHGPTEAINRYIQGGRKIFHPINFARKIINHYRPDLVLTTSAPRLERALIAEANIQSIPSVVLVEQFPTHELEWLASPNFGSHLGVLNQDVKDLISKHGRPVDDITITGNPSFDYIKKIKVTPINNPPKIVFLSQSEKQTINSDRTNSSLNNDVLNELLIGAETYNWQITYRPHPNEIPLSTHHPLLFKDNPHAKSLADTLAGAAVAVTGTSTAGIHALMAGIPLIHLAFTPRTTKPPYENFGTTIVAPSLYDIQTAVLLAMSSHFICKIPEINATQESLKLITQAIKSSTNT